MASNKRDEVLKFVFVMQGQEGLDQFTAALAKAGAQGGESGAELDRLAAQLSALLAQARQVDALQALQDRLAAVDEKFAAAKDTLAQLNDEYGQTGPRTAEVAAQFASAEKSFAALSDQHAALAVRVSTASAALSAAGIDVANLGTAHTELAAKAEQTAAVLAETAAETNRTSAGFAAFKDEATGAAAALDAVAVASHTARDSEEAEAVTIAELGEKYAAFGRVLETLKELALTIGGLFVFEKAKEEIAEILDTGDKFERWGIQFKNAFGGAHEGTEALEKIKELAEETPYSLDTVTDAALKMKRQGLDPLDGTLKTLIDTNAKYGGSTEHLNGLIDEFSKGMAKGELNGRLLVSMQQAGIPATQLLGEAMGKTADQILDMAKKGELGRDAIAQLLAALAAGNSGAADASMNTLSAQVIKLKDDWDEFLKLIADAGVYDFARNELKEVGEALKQGLGDGTLKEKAQAISDAIVAVGQAAVGAVKFLAEHSEAIKTAAEAYAVIRGAMLAVDLAGMVAKFQASTVATLELAAATQKSAAAKVDEAAATGAATAAAAKKAAATQAETAAEVELTAATRANTVATEAETAAVAESAVALSAKTKEAIPLALTQFASLKDALGALLGSIKGFGGALPEALGAFGGLRAALNGVGSAATLLVGGPIPALVGAIGYAVYEAVQMVGALKDWYDETAKLDQIQKESAQTQQDLVAKAKLVAEQTKEAAKTQIKAAEDVAAMSREQAEQYEEQLREAIKYYTALRVAAQADGNKTLVDEYTQKLGLLVPALNDVKTKFGELGDETEKKMGAAQKAVATLTDQIFDLHVRGVDAVSAVAGVFEKLKIETPEGLTTFLGVLNNVKDLSGGVADALKVGLIAQLQKLDEIQFQDFKKNLGDAFNNVKISAEQYQQIIQTIAQSDMLKLGLSAEQVGIQFTEANSKIIASFNDLAHNAAATADQIHLAFAKALDQAQTEGEIQELEKTLKEAFDAGKISAAQFAESMKFAKLRVDELTAAAAKDNEALSALGKAASDLGITLQADLARAAEKAKDAFDVIDQSSAQTAAGIADRRAAFLAYAKAALDASAQLDQGTKDSTRYMLESKAASLDLSDALEKLEQQSDKAAQSQGNLGNAANTVSDDMKKAQQAAANYAEAMKVLADSAATAEEKIAAADKAIQNATNDTERWSAQVEKAAAEFDKRMKDSNVTAYGPEVQKKYLDLAVAAQGGGSWDEFINNPSTTFADTQDIMKRAAELQKIGEAADVKKNDAALQQEWEQFQKDNFPSVTTSRPPAPSAPALPQSPPIPSPSSPSAPVNTTLTQRVEIVLNGSQLSSSLLGAGVAFDVNALVNAITSDSRVQSAMMDVFMRKVAEAQRAAGGHY